MRWLKRARWIVAIIFAYAMLMTFGGCADHFLLHPWGGQVDAEGATQKIIHHNGRALEIWTAQSPAVYSDPAAFVLEFCGNATRAEQIAQVVAQRWRNYP